MLCVKRRDLLRDKFRCVWILVWTQLSYPIRELSLLTTNHKWPRHSLPHNHMYTYPIYTCTCRVGNASSAYDWLCTVTALWRDSSARFRLASKHSQAYPYLQAGSCKSWCMWLTERLAWLWPSWLVSLLCYNRNLCFSSINLKSALFLSISANKTQQAFPSTTVQTNM